NMPETQPEEGAGEEQRTQQTQSMSQAAAANNTNNSQRLVNQEAESAVFCLSTSMATAPEVLGMAGQFPVGRGITWGGSSYPMNHHHHPAQQEHGSRNSRSHLLQAGKFPLLQDLRESQGFHLDLREYRRFPLSLVKVYSSTNQRQPRLAQPHQVYATYSLPSFPLHQVYVPLHLGFPQLIELGNRRNSGDVVPHVSITMTRRNPATASSPPMAMATQEFPIIKKQFVSFPNYRTVANEDGPKTTPTTTTVTQRGPAKDTEIDEGGGGGVHKVFDNEPEAERRATATAAAAAALNLNVVEAVAKEIEHQQAENLNDAFGQRHDHKGRVSDDAMDVDVAKNKREICEQSKLEKAEDHNELNMTENLADQEQRQQQQQQRRQRQRQSICLAREQTIDGDGYRYGNGNGNHQQRRQLSGDLSASDARESSPEQVDVNNIGRQQLTRERNRTQNRYRNPCPNIELLKSSVRAFLADSSPIDWDWDCDWELLELLTNVIELLCSAPADTGNLWSEQAVQAEADMTVSKVSEERETETVDVYPAAAIEQLDQPLDLESELDNNNNNSSSITSAITTEPIDMKYSTSTASRIPRTELTQPVIQPSTRPSATSRIRDVASVQAPIRTTTTPLLGELKRSSTEASSIDTDSVLPERTRLRRQRRMRSQDSVEEKPEDVIERINKLKARISGALSEVKGVLKQYSTESEAEAGAQEVPSPKPPLAASETAPVAFRFVTKVRRRSYFDEAEEEKEQFQSQGGQEAAKDMRNQSNQGYLSVPQRDPKVKREQTPFAFPEKKEASPNLESQEKESQKQIEKDFNQLGVQAKENQGSKVHREPETTVDGQLKSKEIKEIKKETTESSEEIKDAKYPLQDGKAEDATAKSKLKEVPEELPKVNGELPRTDRNMGQLPEKSKSQTKLEFLAKVQSELKSKSVREANVSKEKKIKEDVNKEAEPKEVTLKEATPREPTPKGTTQKNKSLKDVAAKEAGPKEATSQKPAIVKPELVLTPPNDAGSQPDESAAAQPLPKIKKKVIVKAKNPRRASIAAVEPSKIKVEPAVEQIDALIIQRRPSDSEAIVKRKKKLKLMGAVTSPGPAPPAAADASAAEAAAATKSTTMAATTSGNRREATPSIAEEQLATPEVTSVAAKSASAKSDQGEATTPAAEAVTTAAATPTKEAIDAEPAIDGNLAPAGDRSRRASLKLAELVGETVLVVPAPHPVAAAAEALPPSESKEPINQETQLQVQATPQQVAIAADIAPQIATTLRQEESSPDQQQQQQQQPEQQAEAVEATKVGEQAPPGDSLAIMPELKVLAGPVQPVKIETVEQPPHDEAKGQEPLVKKKAPSNLKKLVRKNSIDKKDEHRQDQKQQDSAKLSNILRDKNKINELSSRINKLTPPKKQAVKPTQPKEEDKKQATEEQKEEQQPTEESPKEEAPLETEEPEPETEPAPEPEPAPKPKKTRKIKKKVIIKRQKRRLSIGDTFFQQPEPEEPAIPEIETIERAIAYVTDDEEEEEQATEGEPSKVLKSCLHVRDYKIGDLVLYAERFRKTQVRWKRGRVLERITSISYKLEIEGKEVPAHVSYIKKYTGRKVRFGGKEYLEIDYEQVAEEERRAASYSIWNMV
ncbi:hypothetical protein KR054_007637, partial [Drosophila jambulina]